MRKNERKTGFELCTILISGNIAVCLIGIYMFIAFDETRHIDIYSILLLNLFGIVNILMLRYEKRNRNPIVIILLSVSLIFFMGRVITILYENQYSTHFTRYSTDASDTNLTLLFIIASNIAIFLGLIKKKGIVPRNQREDVNSVKNSTMIVFMIFMFAIIIHFFVGFSGGTFSRFVGYATSFVMNLAVILIMTILYIILNYDRLKIYERVLLVCTVIFYIIMHTLAGSRSPLMMVAIITIISVLSIRNYAKIRAKHIILGLVLMPISIILFDAATLLRSVFVKREGVSTRHINVITKSNIFELKKINERLAPILARAGYLDFSTDLIKNESRYKRVINFKHYIKSIVDNGLTPGFDVFGTPRAANSLRTAQRSRSAASYEDIKQAYHSDMFTVYGEYFVLFKGIPSFIVFFLVAFWFDKKYKSFDRNTNHVYYLYKVIVMYVFLYWIISFGMDWMLIDLIGIIATTIIWKRYYFSVDKERYVAIRQ